MLEVVEKLRKPNLGEIGKRWINKLGNNDFKISHTFETEVRVMTDKAFYDQSIPLEDEVTTKNL